MRSNQKEIRRKINLQDQYFVTNDKFESSKQSNIEENENFKTFAPKEKEERGPPKFADTHSFKVPDIEMLDFRKELLGHNLLKSNKGISKDSEQSEIMKIGRRESSSSPFGLLSKK